MSLNEKYYDIFVTCSTTLINLDDIESLFDKCTQYITDQNLIDIMRNRLDTILYDIQYNNYNYHEKGIGFTEFFKIIHKLKRYKSRDDLVKIVDKVLVDITDPIQRSTIIRIVNNQPPNRFDDFYMNNSKYQKQQDLIEKNCPHCGRLNLCHKSITYIVCGYGNKGFDEGCRRDWCFKCGKKLCKSWYENELFNKDNRYHNERCCKFAAYKNGESYINYCICEKFRVKHKL